MDTITGKPRRVNRNPKEQVVIPGATKPRAERSRETAQRAKYKLDKMKSGAAGEHHSQLYEAYALIRFGELMGWPGVRTYTLLSSVIKQLVLVDGYKVMETGSGHSISW
jgi:hypothetical protein